METEIFKINPTAKIAKFFFFLGIISLFLSFFSRYFILLTVSLFIVSGQLALLRKFITFSLTNEYLSSETGIFGRKIISIPLNRAQNVQLKRSLFERLIDIGEISFESAGEKGGEAENEIVMSDIDNPSYYYKLIMEAVGKNK